MADKAGYVHVEVVKNDNKFVFMMPAGSKYGEAYDACYQMLLEINDMSRAAAEMAKPQEPNVE